MAENRLTVDDLIWPMFVIDGERRREPVASMPGVERLSCDLLVEAVGAAKDLGIPAVAVFPSIDPALKTPDAARGAQPRQPDLPGGARHQGGASGDRA